MIEVCFCEETWTQWSERLSEAGWITSELNVRYRARILSNKGLIRKFIFCVSLRQGVLAVVRETFFHNSQKANFMAVRRIKDLVGEEVSSQEKIKLLSCRVVPKVLKRRCKSFNVHLWPIQILQNDSVRRTIIFVGDQFESFDPSKRHSNQLVEVENGWPVAANVEWFYKIISNAVYFLEYSAVV